MKLIYIYIYFVFFVSMYHLYTRGPVNIKINKFESIGFHVKIIINPFSNSNCNATIFIFFSTLFLFYYRALQALRQICKIVTRVSRATWRIFKFVITISFIDSLGTDPMCLHRLRIGRRNLFTMINAIFDPYGSTIHVSLIFSIKFCNPLEGQRFTKLFASRS